MRATHLGLNKAGKASDMSPCPWSVIGRAMGLRPGSEVLNDAGLTAKPAVFNTQQIHYLIKLVPMRTFQA